MMSISIVNTAWLAVKNTGTGQFNQTSNPLLKKPDVAPSTLFTTMLDRGLVVNIPAYPDMAAGDKITFGIGALQLWGYTVSEQDVGKVLSLSVVDAEMLQSAIGVATDSIVVAYQVTSTSPLYATNKLSLLVEVPVSTDTPTELFPIGMEKPSSYIPLSGFLTLMGLDEILDDKIKLTVFFQVKAGVNPFIYFQSVTIDGHHDYSHHKSNAFSLIIPQQIVAMAAGSVISAWYMKASLHGDVLGCSGELTQLISNSILLSAPQLLGSPKGNSNADMTIYLQIPAYAGMQQGDLILGNYFAKTKSGEQKYNTSEFCLVDESNLGGNITVLLDSGYTDDWESVIFNYSILGAGQVSYVSLDLAVSF